MLYYLMFAITDEEGFLFLKYSKKRVERIHWWHYLTASSVMALGCLFVFSGKIERLEIDRRAGSIRKLKKHILLWGEYTEYQYDTNIVYGVRGY
mmetsp:Transcript_25497/g.39280  ORF Transcript_25497/g.39280 Transcript_25497/m.39280 type:complete len:94 (+) Transcript_25497:482-763(+)